MPREISSRAASVSRGPRRVTECITVDEGERRVAYPAADIDLVKATPPNRSEPALKAEQLSWWIDVMSSQKMLQTKLDLNKLMLK